MLISLSCKQQMMHELSSTILFMPACIPPLLGLNKVSWCCHNKIKIIIKWRIWKHWFKVNSLSIFDVKINEYYVKYVTYVYVKHKFRHVYFIFCFGEIDTMAKPAGINYNSWLDSKKFVFSILKLNYNYKSNIWCRFFLRMDIIENLARVPLGHTMSERRVQKREEQQQKIPILGLDSVDLILIVL